MIKLQYFFICFISMLSSIVSQKPILCNRSCPGGAFDQVPVPYPFGFSSGCQIQLNCTSNGKVLIGEYSVQQIDSYGGLSVSLPAKCGRSIYDLSQLYGEHYAPMSTNSLLMENCTEHIGVCAIPMTTLRQHLEIVNCSSGGGSGNLSCYSGDMTRMFLDYENVTRTGCRFFFSGIVSETIGDSRMVSLEIQMVKLGWWLKGSCDCSGGANCTTIVSPVDGSDGHRCNCNSGYHGDGYTAGSGCRKVKGTMEALDRRKLKLVTGLSCGIGGILILLLFVIRKWLRETRKSADHQLEIFISNYKRLTPKRFKYSEIKKMTKSFLEKLGQGGYGSVYKGELPDGQLVAVKLLSKSVGDGTDFINEVASISRTSHVNIVTLLGFCIERKKRALIYEFMANGSLDKFLRNGGPHLDWNTLFLIAKGIARGLEYLHQGCNTRIVHFDIKPHNILLDEEFVPKIADFGLAKLCRKKESNVSIMDARGTVGYMAPEVFFKSLGGVSHKADVYSYGMMVLEMTGARKNNNAHLSSSSEAYFPDWIHKQVETGGSLEDYGVTTKEEEELARKMLIASLWSIQSDPSERPSISKVVEMFEGSVESLQVPPRNFWPLSPTRSARGAFSLVTQSLTDEKLLTVHAIDKDLSS